MWLLWEHTLQFNLLYHLKNLQEMQGDILWCQNCLSYSLLLFLGSDSESVNPSPNFTKNTQWGHCKTCPKGFDLGRSVLFFLIHWFLSHILCKSEVKWRTFRFSWINSCILSLAKKSEVTKKNFRSSLKNYSHDNQCNLRKIPH